MINLIKSYMIKIQLTNLGTNDAHGLYEQFGFLPLQEPERRMERAIDWEKVKVGYEK